MNIQWKQCHIQVFLQGMKDRRVFGDICVITIEL